MAAEFDSVAFAPSHIEGEAGGHHPVFDAFVELGLTGRDIAGLAHVTPPTVSKWRKGKVRIPGDKLAFLTLVLAHLLDEAEVVDTRAKSKVDAARAFLALQDVLNRDLDATDVREGAQRFREWWSSGAARVLQEKRFHSTLESDDKSPLDLVRAAMRAKAQLKT